MASSDTIKDMPQRDQEGVYRVGNQAMVRVPLFPAEIYLNSFKLAQTGRVLLNGTNDPLFFEALNIASPTLAHEASEFSQNPSGFNAKRRRGLVDGLARYLIRASTRTTPFGGFTGVGAVHVGAETNLELEAPETSPRLARLDYQRVMEMAREIEQDPGFQPWLSVFTNPAAYLRGERVYLAYRDSYGQNQNAQTSSIRATPPVLQVLGAAKVTVPFARLLGDLTNKYPEMAPENLGQFLRSLVAERYLLSTLRPPLDSPDPLNYLLNQLPSGYQSAVKEKAQGLAELIGEISAAPPGSATPAIARLYEETEVKSGSSQNTLQVDTGLHLAQGTVSQELAREVLTASLALARLNAPSRHGRPLEAYANEFLERYGEREVPLLILLDEGVGLGPPPGYLQPPPARPWPQTAQNARPEATEKFLYRIAAEALRSGAQEVSLEPEQIPGSFPAGAELAPSFDVFTLLSQEGTELNAVISPAAFSFPSGRVMGRFAFLVPEFAEYLRQQAHEEEQANPEVIFADLVYAHSSGHANNVSIHPNPYRYQSAVAATPGVAPDQQVNLRDLLVGYQSGFYLRSQVTGQRVIMRTPHLLNPLGSPNAVRFAQEVSLGGFLHPLPWDWGSAGSLPCLPRIRIGKVVVVAPARWSLPEAKDFESWRINWSVPRYVYIGNYDNRLLLDLDHPLHQELLWHEAKNGASFVEEALPNPQQAPVRQGKNHHFAEVVFTFQKTEPVKVSSLDAPSPISLTPQDLVVFPGEEWVYLKLYGPADLQDDLIKAIAPWLGQKNAFFIRYADPERHLRLRFQGASQDLADLELGETLRSFHSRGLLTRASLDTYEREVERYGGPQGLNICEQIFSVDSRAIADLLAMHPEKIPSAWFSVEMLLRGLGFSPEARQEIYSAQSEGYAQEFAGRADLAPAQLSEAYRKIRADLQTRLSPAALAELPEGAALLAWGDSFRQQLEELSSQLREAKLTHPLVVIARSLVHMHANRLGLDRAAEYQVLDALRRAYRGFSQFLPLGVEL